MRKQYHEVIKGKVSRGTGAKKVKAKDKKLAHAGGYFIPTRIGEREIKIIRTRGGNRKIKVKKDSYANVATENGIKRAKIIKLLQGNNPDYTREGVITKGSIIETEIGKAIVTSRPNQHGVINAKLIK
ncbi:MAG: 30S ribosomal protein S8e [Candidatus Anstonellales archaeon]